MKTENYVHKELSSGRWFTLTLAEQLGNIGSEVNRAIVHVEKGNSQNAENAFYRALELIDLTISDSRWRFRLKEIIRMREVLCDRFVGDNQYNSSFESLRRYFYQFGYLARNQQ